MVQKSVQRPYAGLHSEVGADGLGQVNMSAILPYFAGGYVLASCTATLNDVWVQSVLNTLNFHHGS